ncbi:MAG TPA: thioredoxin family protein [Acetobacteraceae bacterium]|nr:thioredoxin family protein [Acetobacteraceae bacterium]
MIDAHPVVSREAWLQARRQFLAREKAFTRQRDLLNAERRALPWVRVEQPYEFATPQGSRTLAELFDGRSQLIVYHLMFAADWDEPCWRCAFWADNFNGIPVHLRHRDVTLIAVSSAPLEKLEAMRRRMGWSFTWVSSGGSAFNRDLHVSFTPEELAAGEVSYNYRSIRTSMTELPGISVFYRDPTSAVFHTYSCYSRGLDLLNGAFNYLDLVPKGRDDEALEPHMAWVRLHDRYED